MNYSATAKPQPSITVSWIDCGQPERFWCPLENVNLSNVNTIGVYIIWHEGNPGRVVRIGQGNIKDRLCAHRNDEEILAYKKNGTLRVTWASVPSAQLDRVERYLANRWPPLVGDCFPDVEPIAVNSPWS
jgi:hypothetical protein